MIRARQFRVEDADCVLEHARCVRGLFVAIYEDNEAYFRDLEASGISVPPNRRRISNDFSKFDESSGRPISRAEFLGSKRIVRTAEVASSSRLTGADWQLSCPGREVWECEAGFVDAFAEPPYTVRFDFDELMDVFARFQRDYLFGLCDDLRVLTWPTHWSSFFDAGREWWGEYLWTVAAPGGSKVTAIAASATD